MTATAPEPGFAGIEIFESDLDQQAFERSLGADVLP